MCIKPTKDSSRSIGGMLLYVDSECLRTLISSFICTWYICNSDLAMGYSKYRNNSFSDHHQKKLFSGDQYQDDINTENPLGTGGRLAVIFANLMRNLWSGKERSLSPYKLKVRMLTCIDFILTRMNVNDLLIR